MNTTIDSPALKLAPPLPDRRSGTRVRWALAGDLDRSRYGALVADGEHTHATIGLDALVRDGHATVAGWAIETKHPRLVQLAELRALLALDNPRPDPAREGDIAADLRDRIDHADQSRRAAARLAEHGALAAAQRHAETRVARLDQELLLIEEAAVSARVRWDEHFAVLAAFYSRSRSHRARGARPARSSRVPAPAQRRAVGL